MVCAKVISLIIVSLNCVWCQTQTANSVKLKTWMHDKFELNSVSAVADDAVRRSPYYNIQIAEKDNNQRFDSFVYMSIPRGGREKNYSSDDGAEFSSSAHLTMSWTSFLYNQTDCWVYIQFNNLTIETIADITIRPKQLNLPLALVDSNTVRIFVPYSPNGFRFSVEIKDYLYTAFNDMSGGSGHLNNFNIGKAIHTEPRNALLIFAEPMLDDEFIPSATAANIHFPTPGVVDNLDNVNTEIIYFRSGIYSMPWNYHAKLSEQVRWVYFEPGAFVKGAFQFLHETQTQYKFTGFGIVSGEKYIYEADTSNNYMHKTTEDCHATCIKLLRLSSAIEHQQLLEIRGVTFMEPPYNSFVVYGDENSFRMDVAQFKMIGAWYWQTDGLELYSGSTMVDTFIHSNDDVLKIYHNDLVINNTVIWKNENGPVIQWGWAPRNIKKVLVNNTYVIHNKMFWSDVKENTCIINSCNSWSDTNTGAQPNERTNISNLRIENTYVEGLTNCALRLYILSNTKNIYIKNLIIDNWNSLDIEPQSSKFQKQLDKLTIGDERTNGCGLKLENYIVNGKRVQKLADNWNSTSLGRLNFDGALWNNWDLI